MVRPSFSTRWLAALPLALAVVSFTVSSQAAVRADGAATSAANASVIAATPSHQPMAAAPLLPDVFAGWQISGTPETSTDAQVADNGDAAVLSEYGFARYEAAAYARNGETLDVKAIEFGDATGAYGAFTFYRRPNMAPEPIGQGGAFNGTRVLFWSGTILVDAKFSRLTAMSVSELRDLAKQLPPPQGNRGVSPTLPEYLPQRHLEPETVQYAVGPKAYMRSGGVLPADLVGFDKSAEVVTGQYNAMQGTGTLTIISYPTPEIAVNRENAIQAYLASHGSGNATKPSHDAWTPALAGSNPPAIQSRRSGPLVAVTSGAFSAGVAHALLQGVYYDAELTMGNSTRKVPDTVKLAQVILSVAILVGIFALIAIIAGISLGGGRVMWRKLRKESAEDESAEFIRLNLKD